ncbi:MAG: substrate-binding domain-containing protein, partial [Spirochaetota bacterium]
TKYGIQTLTGYRNILKREGISVPEAYINCGAQDGVEESGYFCMKPILETDELPTAVFCAADIYAIGAIRRIKEIGLSVPGDLSVIGMDNILLCRYVEPSLTTVKYGKDEMGKTAVSTIIKIIKNEYTGPQKIIFNGELVERKSVANIQK